MNHTHILKLYSKKLAGWYTSNANPWEAEAGGICPKFKPSWLYRETLFQKTKTKGSYKETRERGLAIWLR